MSWLSCISTFLHVGKPTSFYLFKNYKWNYWLVNLVKILFTFNNMKMKMKLKFRCVNCAPSFSLCCSLMTAPCRSLTMEATWTWSPLWRSRRTSWRASRRMEGKRWLDFCCSPNVISLISVITKANPVAKREQDAFQNVLWRAPHKELLNVPNSF